VIDDAPLDQQVRRSVRAARLEINGLIGLGGVKDAISNDDFVERALDSESGSLVRLEQGVRNAQALSSPW
jgi:hypothetical protein